MKRNDLERKVLQAVVKVVGAEVRKNSDIWPPICCGIMHQPKRPIKKTKGSEE